MSRQALLWATVLNLASPVPLESQRIAEYDLAIFGDDNSQLSSTISLVFRLVKMQLPCRNRVVIDVKSLRRQNYVFSQS